ncbi:MAG: 50S ribosome-binding GTPase [Archaeoglobaceae archaeon]|nr:50S ribosome-binding GTPase [Archaeoglobaceae archaeon]
MIRVALAGNPNVGKSVIFNALTGMRQKIGNWPGVTVEKKEGVYKYRDVEFHVVDLPGIYGLTAHSIDEKIARDYILKGKPDVVVDIVDASNIERNLYLTMQLMEMEANIVIALNKMDLAEQKGYKIDVRKLSKELGIPVIPTIAVKGVGIEELKNAILQASKVKREPYVRYSDGIERYIELVKSKIIENSILPNYPPKFVAIKLLEFDDEIMREAGIDGEVVEKWISSVS